MCRARKHDPCSLDSADSTNKGSYCGRMDRDMSVQKRTNHVDFHVD